MPHFPETFNQSIVNSHGGREAIVDFVAQGGSKEVLLAASKSASLVDEFRGECEVFFLSK